MLMREESILESQLCIVGPIKKIMLQTSSMLEGRKIQENEQFHES